MPSKPTKSTKSSTPKAGRPAGDASRPTRAEQKQARLAAARAELARKQRQSRTRKILMGAGIAAAVLVLVLVDIFVLNHSKKSASAKAAASASAGAAAAASAAPGRQTPPPWDAPSDVPAAVAAAGLPMLGEEGSAMHIHAHLDVIAGGQHVAVPADIGVSMATNQISPLHTHDTSAVIHVESPTKQDFTLGQFFREWQVSLGADHVGGLKADATNQLKVYVNGKAYAGDPNGIVLHEHDEIAVVYGTAAQQANPPGTYQFGSGL